MKTLLKLLVGFVGLLLVAAVVLYVLAALVPTDYRPADLSQEERERAARQFIRRAVNDFHTPVERAKPFDLVIEEGELNKYLASMDEVVAQLPGESGGTVRSQMRDSRLAGPAVAMHEGELSLMVRQSGYDKVLTLRVKPSLTDAGLLRLDVAGARIGRLPVPRAVVDRAMESLRSRAADAVDADSRSAAGGAVPTAQQMRRLMAAVVRAIGGEPITPVLGLREAKRVRLAGLDIEEGKMTLHFTPEPPAAGG